jgi:hypothetical protein
MQTPQAINTMFANHWITMSFEIIYVMKELVGHGALFHNELCTALINYRQGGNNTHQILIDIC